MKEHALPTELSPGDHLIYRTGQIARNDVAIEYAMRAVIGEVLLDPFLQKTKLPRYFERIQERCKLELKESGLLPPDALTVALRLLGEVLTTHKEERVTLVHNLWAADSANPGSFSTANLLMNKPNSPRRTVVPDEFDLVARTQMKQWHRLGILKQLLLAIRTHPRNLPGFEESEVERADAMLEFHVQGLLGEFDVAEDGMLHYRDSDVFTRAWRPA
jgi:hypothetical protein